ncbi:hypothetical protein LTR74_018705, partial [Friedmanniomyces endolithicus]
MGTKKSKRKVIVPMPENVDQVAKDAYDRGELGTEVYEKLVRAGLHDMREPDVSEWKDTTAVYAEGPPPPPSVHDYDKDYIGEYIEPEEALAAECVVEEALLEVEMAEEYPVDGVTEGVEVQGDRGKEPIAKEEREATGMEEEDEEEWK